MLDLLHTNSSNCMFNQSLSTLSTGKLNPISQFTLNFLLKLFHKSLGGYLNKNTMKNSADVQCVLENGRLFKENSYSTAVFFDTEATEN